MNNEAKQGEPLSLSIESFGAPDAAYMLESAINATAAAATDSEDRTALILDDHLKSLCALQLSHLERLADYDYAVTTGFESE